MGKVTEGATALMVLFTMGTAVAQDATEGVALPTKPVLNCEAFVSKDDCVNKAVLGKNDATTDEVPVEEQGLTPAEVAERQERLNMALDKAVTAADNYMAARQEQIDKGKKVFKRKCQSCHDASEKKKKKVGPPLWQVHMKPAGHVEGYRYSKQLLNSGLIWDAETLDQWIKAPKSVIKRSRMSFRGIKDQEDRDALITYLKSLHPEPEPTCRGGCDKK